MTTFDYQRPASLAEAFALLRQEGAVALAGGTDLAVALRNHSLRPSVVVDLKSVGELGVDVTVTSDRLQIGGRVVMNRLIDDERVGAMFPALVEAASVVGSTQIRNRATLAGNLCNASPAADTAPALLAYSANIVIDGPDGTRSVPVDGMFTGPGSTILKPGEVVTSIELPLSTGKLGSAFGRVTRRRGVDLASVSVACVVDPSGKVRVGLGAVGPTPLVAESTVDDLLGGDGWANVLSVASPISDVRAGADYRKAMLEVYSRRTLRRAMDRLEAGV